MSALEQMRPFFRLCQFVGFIPFRMEIDERTEKFRQFSFSWRNPVTWWYVVIAIFPFMLFMFGKTVQESEESLQSSVKLPLTISMSKGLSNVIYFFLLFLTRFWVTFFYTTLRQAIQQMQIVERFLGEHTHCCRCTVKKRIFIGIIFAFFWIGSIWVVLQHFVSVLIQKIGYLLTGVFSCASLLMAMTFCCAIILMHLAYYIMGYYIRVLRCELQSKSSGFVDGWTTDRNYLVDRTSKFNSIKKSQRIFGVICKASAAWNRIFFFPALAIIPSKLLTSSFCVFNFIQGLISPNVYLSMVRWLMLNSFLGDIVLMAIVFVTADIPVQEAEKLKEKVIEISNNRLLIQPTDSDSIRENLQAIVFLEQIREDRLRLSTGLFSVGIHLVPTVRLDKKVVKTMEAQYCASTSTSTSI